MNKIAHIHLKGPLIKAAKALIIEKPLSLGWNSQLQNERWAFVFKAPPSERAIKTAQLTGFDYEQHEGYSAISLPDVKERDIDTAVERFNVFADKYAEISKKAASIIYQHINTGASVVRVIKARKQYTIKDHKMNRDLAARRVASSYLQSGVVNILLDKLADKPEQLVKILENMKFSRQERFV